MLVLLYKVYRVLCVIVFLIWLIGQIEDFILSIYDTRSRDYEK